MPINATQKEKDEFLSKNIKILSNITYDRKKLEDHYNELCAKNKDKDYYETICSRTPLLYDKEVLESPYFRCNCPACLPTGKHQHAGIGHKLIVDLKQYGNKEILKLIKDLDYLIDEDTRITIWIYKPNFVLPPHKDFSRKCVVLVPIIPANGGVGTNIYWDDLPIISYKQFDTVEHNDKYLVKEYKYSTKHPTLINFGSIIHGCHNDNRDRVYLHFQVKIPWNEI
jgi:hypothetical protein